MATVVIVVIVTNKRTLNLSYKDLIPNKRGKE